MRRWWRRRSRWEGVSAAIVSGWQEGLRKEAAMIVIQLTTERRGLGDLIDMMRSIVQFVDNGNVLLDIRVGIDPVDNGAKFSVNGHTWSPPAHGIIRRGTELGDTQS
jgi:hypothetical protein